MDSIFAFQSLPRRLVNTAFDPDATPHDLLVLVSSLAVFWWAIFGALHKVLHPFAQRQQWLKQAMGREYDRVGMSMCKALNVGWTRERYIEITLNDWPKMQGIYLQHFVGGALCVPAVLGFDDSWATSLACLGVLSEMGWELADVTDIFVTRSMTTDGKERVPNTMVFILMVHHSMTLTMGLPMVLKYRELKEMHQMTFNLQWAAAIAISMNEYTKCLDLSKPRQMLTFRLLNGIGFVIMVWMRGIQWFVLSGRLLTIWYNDDEWAFVALGSIICVLISAFNIILCIYPYGKKMLKYGPVSKKLTRVDTAETVAAMPDSDDER
ncbi:hypothetical protein ACHAWF_006272 [Thalassiosira exigua]